MPQSLIYDGYTQPGYIAEAKGLHGSVRFRFRPMISEQTDTFARDEFKRRPPLEAAVIIAAATKEQIVEWDVFGKDGRTAAVSVANIRALPSPIFNRLFNIIAGYSPSDVEHGLDVDEGGDDYAKRLLESAAAGKPVGQVQREADAKNSVKPSA